MLTVKDFEKWASSSLTNADNSDREYFNELRNLLHSLSTLGLDNSTLSLVPLKIWNIAVETEKK